MHHVSTQGIDEHMINVHYYHYHYNPPPPPPNFSLPTTSARCLNKANNIQQTQLLFWEQPGIVPTTPPLLSSLPSPSPFSHSPINLVLPAPLLGSPTRLISNIIQQVNNRQNFYSGNDQILSLYCLYNPLLSSPQPTHHPGNFNLTSTSARWLNITTDTTFILRATRYCPYEHPPPPPPNHVLLSSSTTWLSPTSTSATRRLSKTNIIQQQTLPLQWQLAEVQELLPSGPINIYAVWLSLLTSLLTQSPVDTVPCVNLQSGQISCWWEGSVK